MAKEKPRKISLRKARQVTGQCKACLKDRHHYGRAKRGCACGCASQRGGAL